jgi:thioredoxin 1
MSSALAITDATFQSEVVESSIPVLVDFWAVWCGPCKMVAPIVDELAGEYEGKVKVGKVDVDSEQKIATDFGIRSIPTILIFKDGKVAETVVGAVPKKHLQEQLDAVLAG